MVLTRGSVKAKCDKRNNWKKIARPGKDGLLNAVVTWVSLPLQLFGR
jgi:hypothetical protein